MSASTTGEIPSSGGAGTESLEDNTVMVVLGASGDLAKKKVRVLFPVAELLWASAASSGWIVVDGRRFACVR